MALGPLHLSSVDVDDLDGQFRENSTYKDAKLKTSRDCFAYIIRNLRRRWTMENMIQHSIYQSFGTNNKDLDRNNKGASCMAKFYNIIKCNLESAFKISYISRARNEISDSLSTTTRFFRRVLCFIICFILVKLSCTPQIYIIKIFRQASVLGPTGKMCLRFELSVYLWSGLVVFCLKNSVYLAITFKILIIRCCVLLFSYISRPSCCVLLFGY